MGSFGLNSSSLRYRPVGPRSRRDLAGHINFGLPNLFKISTSPIQTEADFSALHIMQTYRTNSLELNAYCLFKLRGLLASNTYIASFNTEPEEHVFYCAVRW